MPAAAATAAAATSAGPAGPCVHAHREGFWLSCVWPFADEEHGPAALVFVHEAAVLEVADERGAALDAAVADVAHLRNEQATRSR
jgi:hypothetical protein